MADMRRRNFFGVMGGAAAWPLAARAQQDEVRRVGMLWSGEEQYLRNVKNRAAFLHHLRELGYVEGKTIQIHERYAEGVLDRLPGLARELVALKVDVIVAVAVAASLAAREATDRSPHCHGSCRQSHRGWINQEPVPAGWQRHWHDLDVT